MARAEQRGAKAVTRQGAKRARDIDLASWLKREKPPTASELAKARRLAGPSRWQRLVQGDTLIREDEPGDRCYILCRGSAEVLLKTHGHARRKIATLRAGTLLGERALLTDGRRDATVRALEDCELLTISRPELLAAMRSDRDVAMRVLDLMNLRSRPRRAPSIDVYERADAKGERFFILRDPARGRYFRLSPAGLFLWERLDGSRTLADLTADYEDAFKILAPESVVEEVEGLARAGFAEVAVLRPDVQAIVAEPVPLLRRVEGVLDWEITWSGVDPVLTRLYARGLWWLFTPPAQAAIAGIALIGLFVFGMSLGRVGEAIVNLKRPGLLLSLLPSFALTVLVHELGHAVTAKAFDREIQRAGVGWHWFVPIVFVDTSDMWLAGRWPRLAVNVAGLYANAVLGGLASIAAWLSAGTLLSEALWLLAVINYALALLNLNPWLEHDGYFLLMDLLDRPDLHRDSLAWIRRDFIAALRSGKGLRGHRVDLVFGLGAVAYVALMASLAILLGRYLAYPLLAKVLPSAVAMLLAGLLAMALAALAAGGVLGPFFLPSTAERSRLRNMQLGAWMGRP